ncbi:hypothetical protein AnigIFM59636_002398 [Aspergillus niger]|nr:hypothetical protein AnigIFM59636_002398 [Aspergillus niger]
MSTTQRKRRERECASEGSVSLRGWGTMDRASVAMARNCSLGFCGHRGSEKTRGRMATPESDKL